VSEEGLKLHPYRDSKGIPTISIGCTYYEDGTPVKMTDPPISKERALSLFTTVRKKYENAVSTDVTSNINQHQFNALVSICYNIGTVGFKSSTLLKRVNANPKDPLITEAFKMWRFAESGEHNGKDDDGDGLIDEPGEKIPSLLPRRIREANLYFS
jgi:lysozyme